MTKLILLDTSAWICFFQAKNGHPIQGMVKNLLMEQRAATTPPVILELLEGLDPKTSVKEFLSEMEALPSLDVTEAIWKISFKLSRQLRQASKEHVPFSDLLIACIAMEHDCALLHADPLFDEIAKVAPLRLQRLNDEKMAA